MNKNGVEQYNKSEAWANTKSRQSRCPPMITSCKHFLLVGVNLVFTQHVLKYILFVLLCVGIAFNSPLHAGGQAEGEPAWKVRIVKPINGWSGDRLLQLEAQVSDPEIRFAHLIENGTQRMVRVKNGRVSEKLVLSPGSNQIVVQVKDPKTGKIWSDHVVLFSNVPKKDIKIILTWDTDGTDIDLHVINPEKVDCYYGNRETQQGGTLDVDITDGYGPEVFTQANATRGEYKVQVIYYSSNNHPQTLARVQVILFEGTDMEKRYNYEKILVKTGDTSDIGTFDIKHLEGGGAPTQ